MKYLLRFGLSLVVLVLLGLLAGPAAARVYWTWRASNPVRRGVARARQLGCFSCHGNLGTGGIKDPGLPNLETPAWDGGMYMMYVKNDDDIRRYILKGSVPGKSVSNPGEKTDAPSGGQGVESPTAAVAMPSFQKTLSGTDLEDLVAAYKYIAGMVRPPADSAEQRGFDIARKWNCSACHGEGASGGLPNPRSFTGFIPGWYGPDFHDLVRDRQEFDEWIQSGSIPRLAGNPIAAIFLRRQRVSMPAYRDFSTRELDDLWAYVNWLEQTGGGVEEIGERTP
jgi:mono/diheme cytochrome c family protein